MDKIIYSIRNVTKKFPGVVALNNICLDIPQGKIMAIVGENGAGKSTLMNILFGVYEPTEGTLIFNDREQTGMNTKRAQDLGIAMIHQELSLSNTLSVAENIFAGRLPKTKLGFVDKKALYSESRKLLAEVGLESLNPTALVREINVSQQQQVEIAKALSLDAKFLILDEPTSSLTLAEAEYLHKIMLKLKSKGITMLYISHKLDEIMKISDEIAVFRDGALISVTKKDSTTIEEMISNMVGREFSNGYERETYKTDQDSSEVVFEVQNFCAAKVHDVSFKLHKGEVLGITGLVGAGRSELLQAVFGADKKQSGKTFINGQEIEINHSSVAIKHGIGLIPEGRKLQSLFLKFSVKENISIVDFRGALNRWGLLNKRKERQITETYSEKLKIKTPGVEQKIVNLSGGNQQKAVIARWLLTKPQILFLDEPTQGIDIGAKNEIYDIISSLAKEGVSIIVVSSEMQETIGLCDRVLVMYEGRITGEIMQHELDQEKLMTCMSGK